MMQQLQFNLNGVEISDEITGSYIECISTVIYSFFVFFINLFCRSLIGHRSYRQIVIHCSSIQIVGDGFGGVAFYDGSKEDIKISPELKPGKKISK
jgi:hypothetical protein